MFIVEKVEGPCTGSVHEWRQFTEKYVMPDYKNWCIDNEIPFEYALNLQWNGIDLHTLLYTFEFQTEEDKVKFILRWL